MNKIVYSLCLFLPLAACIEPFRATIPDGERPMVVDGLITDQEGPYTVTIYRSAALNNPYDLTDWAVGAHVTVFDDQGNSEQLTEISPGTYTTNTMQGAIGRTYHVRIELKDGNVYESIPEVMLPVGDFSNLRYKFNEVQSPGQEEGLNPKNGFDVYLDAELTPEQQGLTRWRWTGTFEFETWPELRLKLKVPAGPIPVWLPDPVPCSGWVVPRGSTVKIQQSACTCCFCWVNQYSPVPLLSDKRFVNNNKMNQVYIAYIPANDRYFFDKYYLEVEQMSISQAVYSFWESVARQKQQGSDLFQTPSGKTQGNVVLLTEGGLPAVGVFGASAVRNHSFVIPKQDIPYPIYQKDTIAESCMIEYRYSSTTQPDFW
jgi:Domain of unknown function (DUF4249)